MIAVIAVIAVHAIDIPVAAGEGVWNYR